MRIDGQRAMGGVEGFGDGDEVEERSGERDRDRKMSPARPAVERGRQHRQRGYAVEKDRNSEPEKRHGENFKKL